MAGFRFAVIVGIGNDPSLLPGFGKLAPQLLEFRIQSISFLLLFEVLCMLCSKLSFQLLQLLPGDNTLYVNGTGHKGLVPGGSPATEFGSVGMDHPVTDVVQLLDHLHGIVFPHGFRAMHGLVSHLLDDNGFLQYSFGEEVLECGFIDKGAQVSIIGHTKAVIVPV